VSAFPAGNALIVHAPAANVAEIQKMVKEIDLPREQVYIEAKFLELSDEAIKDLGINWQMLEGYKIGVGSLKGSVEDKRVRTKTQTDRLSQADNRNRQDNINELYDMYGNQYEEKTLITEEYPPGSGLYRTREVPTPTRTVQDNIGQSRDVSSLLEDSLVRTLTDIRTAVLTADDLKLVLSALKQQAGISIASNPKIIVANEETALIKIADEEPNVRITRERATVQGQPDLTTSQLDPQQPTFTYGITLEVTPTINTASNITLRIKPVLSRWLKDKVAPDGNTFPIISTKTITTTFSLESGMTAAIGGLTETLDRDAQAKVPLLGDVPLVGKLFTHSHRQRSQKETIIFVTVGLATPEAIERDHGLPENAKLIHRHLQPEEQSPKRARTKDARHLRETAVRELERKP
jgi:type II secretory pathway component GspD/PulD (secretin)